MDGWMWMWMWMCGCGCVDEDGWMWMNSRRWMDDVLMDVQWWIMDGWMKGWMDE